MNLTKADDIQPNMQLSISHPSLVGTIQPIMDYASGPGEDSMHRTLCLPDAFFINYQIGAIKE